MATTGSRPTNSGIIPNFIRSSGSTSLRSSPTVRSSLWTIFAPKPRPFSPTRRLMIASMPWKAPPQMKRMFDGVDLDVLLLVVLLPAARE